MKKQKRNETMVRMGAALLAVLLCVSASGMTAQAKEHADVDWAEMTYEGVDTKGIDECLQKIEKLLEEKDPSEEQEMQLKEHYAVMRQELDKAYTQQSIGEILHYSDVTDTALTEGTVRNATATQDVHDRSMATLRKVLESPYKEVLEDEFTESQKETILDYEALTQKQKDLLEKEESLEKEFDHLSEQEYTFNYMGVDWTMDLLYENTPESRDSILAIYTGLAKAQNDATVPVYLELVQVRRAIAEEAGYDSYIDYAYDVVYGRDFTGEDIAALRETILKEIAPQYKTIQSQWQVSGFASGLEEPVGGKELVEKVAPYIKAVAPELEESYVYMQDHQLYHIDNKDTMIASGFTIDLPQYGAEFIYNKLGDSVYDYKTLIHEFGHFNAGYYAEQNVLFDALLVDVAEIQSQGLEMITVDAMKELLPDKAPMMEAFLLYNMLDGVMTGFEYDEFEQEVYKRNITTAEELNKLAYEIDQKYTGYFYEDNGEAYEWSGVNHLFVSPLYYIGYATSGLSALDIWATSKGDYEKAVEEYVAISKVPLDMPYQEATVNCGLRNMMNSENIAQLGTQIRAWVRGASIPQYDADGSATDGSEAEGAAEEGGENGASDGEAFPDENWLPDEVIDQLQYDEENTLSQMINTYFPIMRPLTILGGALSIAHIAALIIGIVAFLKRRG